MTLRVIDAATSASADLRLAPMAVAAWAGAAWASTSSSTTSLSVGTLLLALGAAAAIRSARNARDGRWAGVAFVLLAAGLVLVATSGHLAVRQAGQVGQLAVREATARVELLVTGDARPVAQAWPGQEPRVAVRVRVEQVNARGQVSLARTPVLVLGGPEWQDVAPGQRFSADGALLPAGPGDDVEALFVARSPPLDMRPSSAVRRAAEHLREGLRAACAGLSDDSRGLVPGLVVGDTAHLPADLEEAMQRTGLTHLTAVSGANVAIVCGSVLLLSSWLGAGRRLRLVLAGAALVWFVILARPEPSVLRAAVMGAVGLAGLAVSRRGRGVPALSVAVVLLVCVDPWLSRSFGFALSVLATTGLLLFARPWAVHLGRWMPMPMAHAVAIPAAAQAVCGPVVVLLQPALATLAVPANMLAGPAVAPATVLGAAATVVAPLWPAGASGLAHLAGLATGWIALVARTSAAVPASSLPWPQGWRGALLMALATAVLVLLLGAVLRRDPPSRRAPHSTPTPRTPGAPNPRRAGRRRLVLATAGGSAFLLAATLAGPLPLPQVLDRSWPPESWRVVACDVGQGDALVVRTAEQRAILIDVGPEAEAVDDCLRRLEVRHLDLIVLSHFHTDHVAGLDGALRGRTVGEVLVSPLAEPAAQASQVQRSLSAHPLTARPVWAGASGTAGDLSWQVLWPDPVYGTSTDRDESAPNDASLVLRVQAAGLSLLATGDIEPDAQIALARAIRAGPIPHQVDVLKAAHHGSAEQDPGLHALLRPRAVLVSSGVENTYGHPAPSALQLFRDVGAVVLRTDTGGDLAVVVDGSALRTVTSRRRRRVLARRVSVQDGRLPLWRRRAEHRAGPPPASVRTRWNRRRSCCCTEQRVFSPTGRWRRSWRTPARQTRRSRSPRCAPPATSLATCRSWPARRCSERPKSSS